MAGAHILIIEDDADSMALAQYLLNHAGHRTIAANDGRTGAQLALDQAPDLIVCDLQLPAMDGYQVVRHLYGQSTWRRVPLIAVTAASMTGDREKVLEAGFDGYISKPIVPENFVAQVEAFLHAASKRL
jgi:two-component system cell cycle response regulator DivK